MTSRLLAVAAAVSSVALAACAVDPDDGVAAADRRSVNSLAENRVSDHAALVQRIVAAPLRTSTDTKTLARATGGDQLLDYAARCALYDGVQVNVAGLVLPRARALELGPAWPQRGLDAKEQGWLMACLLAHINATGAQVDISLRGDHPSLKTDAAERKAFPAPEGAFWGAFSTPNPDGAGLVQYACYSQELGDRCGAGQATAILWDRLCAHGGCADLTVVGPCSSTDPSEPVACEAATSDHVSTCYDTAAKRGAWPSSAARYEQVITTYLRDLPDCD